VTITYEVRNGTCLLALKGDFDRANLPELAETMKDCLGSASSIALDFQAVTFVDGGVLSLLNQVLEDLEGRGWLGVVRPTPWVRRLIGIADLSARTNFRIFSTMQEALEVIDQG